MIKAGFLIAYDYHFIFNSLPQIYPFVDEIVLAIDVDRKTWMGNDFEVSDDFFERIEDLDVDHKIKIYEDQFYIKGEKPMDLETRERNMLSDFMGDDCWKMQIDSDEYCLNFQKVISYLKKNQFLLKKSAPEVNFLPVWITLFKQNERGFFIIKPCTENFSMIFNRPKYKYARNSEGLDLKIDYQVIHQSWARTEEEILTKIQNWGHAHDFNVESFYGKWEALNENNYKEYFDFHPIYKGFWEKLEFIEAKNITELLEKLEQTTNLQPIKVSSKLKKLRMKSFLGI
ncbi:hypothetical protein SAMN05421789_102249 [Kaistella chaponensis]|uniref:Glycosyl transferase family 2 n=1 Tax=Kaistella chaponensis TaxID=713588 RepID=A0A1N7JPE0_9FLAO|nr:hypothetical protein [Kaistella chaponensis]SIS51219.1 hypothetical protein SAMN05421789_102249 [Kaistella chaponensis]